MSELNGNNPDSRMRPSVAFSVSGSKGNTPDMKDVTQWSRSSCLGQGNGGEMGKHPRHEEWDHVVAFLASEW